MPRAPIAFIIVAVFITCLFLATPSSSQDRTAERLGTLETRVAILEQEVGIALVPADAETSGETFTLSGSVTLKADSESITVYNKRCYGAGGYSDMREGARVLMRDGSGNVVALGQLEEGVALTATRCDFLFTISDIPYSAIYSLEIARRGEVHYSFEDLESASWTISLSLGR